MYHSDGGRCLPEVGVDRRDPELGAAVPQDQRLAELHGALERVRQVQQVDRQQPKGAAEQGQRAAAQCDRQGAQTPLRADGLDVQRRGHRLAVAIAEHLLGERRVDRAGVHLEAQPAQALDLVHDEGVRCARDSPWPGA